MRKNFQINTYLAQTYLKHHQKDTLAKLVSEYSDAQNILDIGCSNGLMLKSLHSLYPEAALIGIEIADDLIEAANTNLQDINNSNVVKSLIEEYEPDCKFDIIIASGVLSLYDEPFSSLERWVNWLSPDGILVIFGRFNTHDVDTRVLYRNRTNDNGWESGLTSYSIRSISEYLNDKAVDFRFERFTLPFDRAPSKNPTDTWTVKTEDGERLLVNGVNLIAEFHHLLIKRTK